MWRLLVLSLVSSAMAQIPSLGWCPYFQPMASFNMNRFLGTWYEAERFFTVSELGTRCVTTHYTATPEGRILVTNEITSSITGYKRILDGHLQMIGREGEGRVMVKYSSVPLPYESEYSILDTDYDTYAVMWSCSGIGPVHTQNTWLLSRDRLPSLSVMQNAYNALDRFKISRTFFLKTNQADCTILPEPAADSTMESKSVPIEPVVVAKEEPAQKKAVPEVKSSVPEVRSAVPDFEEPAKPMKVPELIMFESEKKEDKMDAPKPEEPAKKEFEKKMEKNEPEKNKIFYKKDEMKEFVKKDEKMDSDKKNENMDSEKLSEKKESEKTSEKKDSEKNSEKKDADKLNEKKDEEKLNEKKDEEKLNEKKDEKKMIEKKDEEKISEKKDAEKLSEKKDAEKMSDKKDSEKKSENYKIKENDKKKGDIKSFVKN